MVTQNNYNSNIKDHRSGTSLVAQWLRVHLPMQGTQIRSLAGDRAPQLLSLGTSIESPCATNPWTTGKESHVLQQRPCVLQLRPDTAKNNWSQIPITNIKIRKTFEMCELPYRDTKWANAIGKLALIELIGAGLPRTFNLYETQCLQSTIKGSTIKYACTALTRKILSSFSFGLCLSYLCYLVSKYLEFFQGTFCY